MISLLIRFNLTIVVTLLLACSKEKNTSYDPYEKELTTPFQSILDSSKVKGSILIYDLKKDTYYSNDFRWAHKGQLPASTFKIPHSIIALELGIVQDDSTLFKWDGQKRAFKSWEQDLIFRDAFHLSCVPCYQEIAIKVGSKRMNEYLDKLEYGHMNVDSVNIDDFWLEGESRISPFEQIDFLKKFYHSSLPISTRTSALMKKMMIIEQNNESILRGKTGWSETDGIDNGWFVGYVESGQNVYFFATNLEPGEGFDISKFAQIRKDVTNTALRHIMLNKE